MYDEGLRLGGRAPLWSASVSLARVATLLVSWKLANLSTDWIFMELDVSAWAERGPEDVVALHVQSMDGKGKENSRFQRCCCFLSHSLL